MMSGLVFAALLSISPTSWCAGSVVGVPLNHVHTASDSNLYGELLARIERLELRDQQQAERIATLESNMAAMADVVMNQAQEIADLKSRIDKGSTVPAPSNDHGDSDSDYQDLEQGVPDTAELKSTIRAFPGPKGTRKLARSVDNGKIAFFARVDVLSVSHLRMNQTIRFEKDVVNIGTAYHPDRGVFTAPVSGTYLFSASVMSEHGVEVRAKITVNGDTVARIFARGTDNRHGQGSQTIILTLELGDNVSVENEGYDESVYGAEYCTFSGLLLWESYSEGIVIG